MTCFGVMKLVLDKTAQAIFGRTELTEEEGNAIRGHLEDISRVLNSGGAPDYANPICRFAYMYCYPAAHAHLFEGACHASPEIRRLVHSRVKSGEPLRVCFFGGGPGTEIVGLGKFLSTHVAQEDEKLDVDVLLLDREPAWDENALITMECVGQFLAEGGHNITFSLQSEHLDFSRDYVALPTSVTGRDLYGFNYAISEAPRQGDSLRKLIASAAATMREGASMVIADREEKVLVALAENLMQFAGLEITEKTTGVRRMNSAEDCNEIVKAYHAHIQRRPRVKFGQAGMDQGAFWMVGTKKGHE
jgi:hypothetical protein